MLDVNALHEERTKLLTENGAIIDGATGTLTGEQVEQINKRSARIREIGASLALVASHAAAMEESRGRKTDAQARPDSDAPDARTRDLAFRAWALGKRATAAMREAAERCGVDTSEAYIDMAVRVSYDEQGREQREFLPCRTDSVGNVLEVRSNPEKRALSSGTTTAGGDSIPTAMMVKYTELQKWFARVAEMADVINTENGQSIPWPTVTDTANSGRVLGEGTTATTTTDPTFSKVTLSAYKISSDAVVVPWELLQDSFIDLSGYLGQALGRRVGRKKNALFTSGTGTGEPKGYIVGAAVGKTASATNAFTMDETIDLEHSVDPAYRALPDTGFFVHDTIAAYLRKMKDGNGRPLWEPSLQAGQPPRFRGYPVFINNDMDSALTTGKKLLAFGHLKSAFVVRNAGSVRFIRDESIYVKEHMTYFEALERCDSNVVDTTALKVLALA